MARLLLREIKKNLFLVMRHLGSMSDQPKISWTCRSAIVSIASLSIVIGCYLALYAVEQVVSEIGILQQGSLRAGHAELTFLQAALDRLAADAKQMDPESPAFPSLGAEQAALIQRMREVERRLGAEALSDQLQIDKAPRVNPNAVSTANNPTNGVFVAGALKVGLTSISSAPEIELSRDAALSQIVVIPGASDSALSGGSTSNDTPIPAGLHNEEPKNAVDIPARTGAQQQRGLDPEARISAVSPEPADRTELVNLPGAKKTNPVTVGNSPLVLRRPAQANAGKESPADKVPDRGAGMDLAALVAHGDQFLGFRDVNAARSFYERAAALGSGVAALHMGMTFDPAFLSRLGLHAAYANPAQATGCYRHAVELGDTNAVELQHRLEEQARVATSKN